VLSSLIYSYTLDSCLINITELNGTWSRKSWDIVSKYPLWPSVVNME
jgi:hypothetical protein